MNCVVLSGYVQKDIKETPCSNGSTKVTFLLSVSRNYKNLATGYYVTDLFKCVRFCTSEAALEYMRKHVKFKARVMIQGEVRVNQVGEQWFHEILVRSVEVLKKASDSGYEVHDVDASDFNDAGEIPSSYQSEGAANPNYSNPWAADDDDGDLPF